MKPKEYLKDHIVTYLVRSCCVLAAIIFLLAFKAQSSLIFVLCFIALISFLVTDIYEYRRKKDFYNKLVLSLKELDKKYLLPAMLEEPSFYEGRLLCDILSECDKSMLENVSDYKRQSKEFREYIEMWVHEAKLPVASLTLMSKNAGDNNEKMSRELKRIDDYIENVLYYARSESPMKDYIIKETSIKKAFNACAMKNRETLQHTGASIQTEGLDAQVMTDAKWLEFIFGQLISNSIKYADDKRPLVIRVSADKSGTDTILKFKDNGIGIAAADLPYIFNKSYTGRNGRKDAKSTGMGLYIVSSLLERLGHKISVSSEEGKYTEFTIIFTENNYYSELRQ
ncbi:MAG: sensor histidine kinase [Lachnospiraceae bacterium]|nr:sensor histidine kinase [Lachnospiraceae bacterium]